MTTKPNDMTTDPEFSKKFIKDEHKKIIEKYLSKDNRKKETTYTLDKLLNYYTRLLNSTNE